MAGCARCSAPSASSSRGRASTATTAGTRRPPATPLPRSTPRPTAPRATPRSPTPRPTSRPAATARTPAARSRRPPRRRPAPRPADRPQRAAPPDRRCGRTSSRVCGSLGSCAVGSLRADQGPGTIVVPDQVVDRTWGRGHTFFDAVGPVVHVAFADPYCPVGRAAALAAGRDRGLPVTDGGTLVVINGPRFSTRAESLWHAAAGWSVVGMTGVPEASLARELGLCYTSVALVTDLDAGLEHGDGVTHDEVLRVFAENIVGVRELLVDALAGLPGPDSDCECRHATDGQKLPFDLP